MITLQRTRVTNTVYGKTFKGENFCAVFHSITMNYGLVDW